MELVGGQTDKTIFTCLRFPRKPREALYSAKHYTSQWCYTGIVTSPDPGE